MPKKGTLKTTNETIQLADTPFAHGGEAELFQIVAPSKYRNYVAKVYFPKNAPSDKRKKSIIWSIIRPNSPYTKGINR